MVVVSVLSTFGNGGELHLSERDETTSHGVGHIRPPFRLRGRLHVSSLDPLVRRRLCSTAPSSSSSSPPTAASDAIVVVEWW